MTSGQSSHSAVQLAGTAAEAGVACNGTIRIFTNGQLRGVAPAACITWLSIPSLINSSPDSNDCPGNDERLDKSDYFHHCKTSWAG